MRVHQQGDFDSHQRLFGRRTMPARTIVSRTPAERAAVRSRHTIARRLAARDISRAADAGGARILDGAHNEASTWSDQLDRYLEGWAEANPGKIFAATAREYRFNDPLVGLFSRWSFPAYFECLQARFACTGVVAAQDLAFFVRGPMGKSPRLGRLTFFREAPLLGLTGVTLITIGERGVIAEAVAYDLNPALDVLRKRPEKRE
jgi:hypothetical protein